MRRAVVLVSLAVGSIAGAQEWQFELSNPVLSPGSPSTFVTLSIDHEPADYAFAAAELSVSATEGGWSDLVGLLSLGAPPYGAHPGQNPGSIAGGDVTGIGIGQLSGSWSPRPGRIDVWRGTFTVTDFTARSIDLSTETARFEVYVKPFMAFGSRRASRVPIEGRGQIQIAPAPTGLALLALGGVAIAGRRRPGASRGRRDSR
jgi:hypothetical protein